MVMAAVREPAAVGVKLTVMMHDTFTATDAPQLFDWLKSPALAPVRVMLERFSVAVPAFVSVTLCAALAVPTGLAANTRFAADKLTIGAAPVPASATVCGLPGALSMIFKVPDSAAATDGVNLTLTMQEAPGASWGELTRQVSVSEKSAALLPVKVMALSVTVAEVEFVTVMLVAAVGKPVD
jgi:hypothetical protein